MLVDMLDADGFDVVDAADADEALAAIEQRPDIRVMFSDIQMPGSMDGLALAHVARRRHPMLGIILASGATFPSSCAMPTAARFFTKPYNMTDVAAAVRALLST